MFDLPGESPEYGLPIREERDDKFNYPRETEFALEREDIRIAIAQQDRCDDDHAV